MPVGRLACDELVDAAHVLMLRLVLTVPCGFRDTAAVVAGLLRMGVNFRHTTTGSWMTRDVKKVDSYSRVKTCPRE